MLLIYWVKITNNFHIIFCVLLCCIVYTFNLWWIVFLDSLWFSVTVIRKLKYWFCVSIAYMLNFFCYYFVGFACFYCLVHQSVVVFCFVPRRRSAAQFFGGFFVLFFLYLSSLVTFVLQVFVIYLNPRVCKQCFCPHWLCVQSLILCSCF